MMKNHLYSYSFIAGFFMLIFNAANLIAQAPLACNRTNDSLELVSFYNQFDGDNWTDNTNWLVREIQSIPGMVLKSAHKAVSSGYVLTTMNWPVI